MLFAAEPYNAFVFNNFTASNAGMEGALAAGGTVNISSYSVGSYPDRSQLASFSGRYTLVGGADLKAANGVLYKGNAYEGGPSGDLKQPGFYLNGGKEGTGASPPIDFSSAAQELDALSASLGKNSATPGDSCKFDGYATTTCTAGSPGLNIIDILDPTILSGKSIVIKSTFGSATLVINVPGAGDKMGGAGFSAFNNGQTVLFNFYQASSLQFGSSSFTASVLAPACHGDGR